MTLYNFNASADPQVIDHTRFSIVIYPGTDLAELTIKAEAVFDEDAAKASKKILEAAGPGKRYFLLVNSDGFFRVTKKARKLGASPKFSDHLAAIACYSNNYSLILLGELYNKINKPSVVTRIFSHKERAKEWLLEQKELEDRKDPMPNYQYDVNSTVGDIAQI
jgi:hypothetical protein